MTELWTALGTSAAIGILVLLALRRLRIVDVPGERSSHERATPRGGGLAVLGGLIAGLAVASTGGSPAVALAVGATSMGALGFADDLRSIPPLTRLAVQCVVAVLPLPWLLDDLSGSTVWRVAFVIGVWCWLIAFVNATNFMDGINGLAVAQAVIAGAVFWLVGDDQSVAALEAGGAVIAGAALGFAPYNFPRARMFLGDVGSYAIGAWLAIAVVIGLRAGVAPVTMLAPVAVFLGDTATTIGRRAASGERWYSAHRSHAYQRLVIAGWSHTLATAFVAFVIAVTSVIGFSARDSGDVGQLLAAAGILVVITAYIATPAVVARRRSTPA